MTESAHLEHLEQVLAGEVRPVLSSHAGTIAVTGVDEARQLVTLEMRGPCGTCYFRRGCEAIAITPVLRERLDQYGYRYRIKGSAHRIAGESGQ